ncbi:hypothetical protein QFZ69_000789 [Arthrobacter sp. V1I7]|nr:hypothetical protein [Arthrobacter sp. V1I7]MDQ0819910.1 hypothetical protein [Arthrobacter sp. V1I7]
MSEMWPQLRPLCRRLALLGWASSAAGMAAGLAVAIASGTRLSPTMSSMQLTAAVCTAVSVTAFVTAAALQPRIAAAPPGDAGLRLESGPELPATIQSLLLGSLALLAGAVAFACAGLVLRGGPSAQSVAFCQVFLLGAAASGFTFMLFSRVSAGGRRN